MTDRDFKRSTEKGARLGFDGIATLALPAARVGVPESGRVPIEHRSIPDRGRVSTAPKPRRPWRASPHGNGKSPGW